MTEYIGFVSIVLVRGQDLVPAGYGQVREKRSASSSSSNSGNTTKRRKRQS